MLDLEDVHVFDDGIVDEVHVPEDLTPGDYLLSWRWDCEESTQVAGACCPPVVVLGRYRQRLAGL